MANTDLDRASRALTQKSKRYSIFSLARNAASYHQNWQQAWRHAEPKPAYDARASLIPFVFIIGSNYVILGGSLKIL